MLSSSAPTGWIFALARFAAPDIGLPRGQERGVAWRSAAQILTSKIPGGQNRGQARSFAKAAKFEPVPILRIYG